VPDDQHQQGGKDGRHRFYTEQHALADQRPIPVETSGEIEVGIRVVAQSSRDHHPGDHFAGRVLSNPPG
jgi:hypothetical protein